jgi:hypothetical protein
MGHANGKGKARARRKKLKQQLLNRAKESALVIETHSPQPTGHAEQPKKPPSRSRWPITSVRTIVSKSWKVAAASATFLGIVTGYLSLVPRISVENSQLLNLADPFATPFVVSNDGPLGINDVILSCLLIYVESTGGGTIEGLTVGPNPVIEGMDPGERATLPCTFHPVFGFTNPLKAADIAIVVNFRPDFVPWHQIRRLRFKTLKGSDGHLYWYPQPLSRVPFAK